MTRNYPRADTNGNHSADGPKPVPNATVPYWRSELHYLDEFRSTPNVPKDCDIAIIGAGMSGVAIAYNLLQLCENNAKPSICMLEARQVCSGATGRNGGHVKVRAITLQKIMKEQGSETADEFAASNNDMIYSLKGVVEKENLGCEFELRRSFDVFLDENDAKEAHDMYHEGVQKGYRWTRERDFVPASRVEQVRLVEC